MSLNSFRQDAMPQNFLTDQIPGTHCSQETKHLLQDPSLYNHNMIKQKGASVWHDHIPVPLMSVASSWISFRSGRSQCFTVHV
jgi:hypothetical protein